jgi:hypothetical protein
MPAAWSTRKGHGGWKKQISMEGYFCPNQECEYWGITKEGIYAPVGVLFGNFMYGQVVKYLRPRKLVEVERRVRRGSEAFGLTVYPAYLGLLG